MATPRVNLGETRLPEETHQHKQLVFEDTEKEKHSPISSGAEDTTGCFFKVLAFHFANSTSV